jgi:hypothetical protein
MDIKFGFCSSENKKEIASWLYNVRLNNISLFHKSLGVQEEWASPVLMTSSSCT